MLRWWDSINNLRCNQVKVDLIEFRSEVSMVVQIIPQCLEIQIIYRIIMLIFKFQFQELKVKEESRRMLWKVIGLFKKQWADSKLINLVQLLLLTITLTTKVTNLEMDQTDQLQESTKEEFIVQVAPSAALLDQVLELEPTVESQVPNRFLAWSSAHVNQIFKMNKMLIEPL